MRSMSDHSVSKEDLAATETKFEDKLKDVKNVMLWSYVTVVAVSIIASSIVSWLVVTAH